MAETNCPIRKFPLTTSGFTAIVAPIPCNYYAVLGSDDGSALIRSSDPTNASAAYQMPGGTIYGLVAPPQAPTRAVSSFADGRPPEWERRSRVPAGDVL